MRPRSGDVAVALFTRDLRVHDNPTLHLAMAAAGSVIPLFVVDPELSASPFSSPNRNAFLADCLDDLRHSLQARGADLVIARGPTVDAVTRLARRTDARVVVVADDVSTLAQRRLRRLWDAGRAHDFEVRSADSIAVVAPGARRPASGDHYKVFTPYFHAWSQAPWRPIVPTPRSVRMPPGLAPGTRPPWRRGSSTSPRLPRGGESTGRRRWSRWRAARLEGYGTEHNQLAEDATSRLSPYVHFGCVSPVELATDARGRPGSEPFLRQLAWRDFFLQVTRAFPALAHEDYRPTTRQRQRRHDEVAFRAWTEGRTGVPIVDAGMRQLLDEGWMPNRARLVCASYLVHDLGIDWRLGARHFLRWLVDGDIANNSGNWQWVAGTGNNRRPKQVMNAWRQARRFDPRGTYVSRHGEQREEVTRHAP